MKQQCLSVAIAAVAFLLIGIIAANFAICPKDINGSQPIIDSRVENEWPDEISEASRDEGQTAYGQTNQMVINGPSEELAASSPLLVPAVNITNQKGEHIAIGTKISEDTILTHNHQMFNLGTYMTMVSSGDKYIWAGAKSDSVGRPVIIDGKKLGQQTRLVTYSQPLTSGTAYLASQKIIFALKAGDKVDIVYWDDTRNQLAVGQFAIIDVANVRTGELTVDDPMGIINKGDSGGGVFFKNQLIGNMWSIGGGAHIALLPPRITDKSEGITIID